MEIEPRSYGKSELAMLYFPNSDPSAALKRLNRWIDNISELKLCLAVPHQEKGEVLEPQASDFDHLLPRRTIVSSYWARRNTVFSTLLCLCRTRNPYGDNDQQECRIFALSIREVDDARIGNSAVALIASILKLN